jgi:hypothetical protein
MTRIIGVLEQELKSAGAWVVSGRLHQAAAATVVRLADGGVVTTDGPFVESKEHLGGFTSSRPRTSMARSVGCRGSPGPSGCRSRFVRSWDSRPDRVGDGDAAGRPDGAEVGRTFGEESGRSLAALIRAFDGIDLAEDAVREAFAVALAGGRAAGCRPTRGAGSPGPPATRPSTAGAARHAGGSCSARWRCAGPAATIPACPSRGAVA